MTGRDKVSNLINSDPFIVSISIFFAVVMWIYVGFIHTDDMSVELIDVPVVVIGQNELIEDGLIATWFNRDSIDITVSGRARDVAKLSSRDVSAVINLSDVTYTGTSAGMYQLSYDVKYPDNVNQSYLAIDSASANYISVRVEDYVTKQVPVKVASDATVPEGYTAEPIVLETETIKISGPESALASVAFAFISIENAELTDTFSEDMTYALLTEGNEPVVNELITADFNSIEVTIPVLMIKELPLIVELTDKNSANDNNTSYKLEPNMITVSGDPSVLRNMENLVVATVDLTSFESELATEYAITLPDGLTNLSGITSASLSVSISGLSVQQFTADNISAINITAGYKVSVMTDSVSVQLRGTRNALSSVSAEDIIVEADLSSQRNATGTYTVPAIVRIKNTSGVDAIGEYKVTVTITAN